MKKLVLVFIISFFSIAAIAKPIDESRLQKPLPRNLWVEMSRVIQPGVVGIFVEFKAKKRRRGFRRDPLFDFLEEFLGERFEAPMPGADGERNEPIGTGFIISEDGFILTNHHVAEVALQHNLKVSLQGKDGKHEEYVSASLVGRDIRGDIALLKVNTNRKLKALKLGDSKKLQVGEYVAAFGNPFGHSNSMTVGIVSAIGREIKEINRFPFIQTDASINPGNSGGPLVDTDGYVIGVNTAIDARAQGIGFAVPIDYIKRNLETLKKGQTVKRGWLGIGLTTLPPTGAARLGIPGTRGVYVTEVRRGEPADKAGMQVGDIIVGFNKTKIKYAEDLMSSVQDTPVGEAADIKIMRQGQKGFDTKVLKITIGQYPDQNRWGRSRRSAPAVPAPKKELGSTAPKVYRSSEAPFNIGFGMTDSSSGARKYYDIPVRSPFGPIITRVDENSPAAKAGLQVGDVLLGINGETVANVKNAMPLFKQGSNKIQVARKGQKLNLTLGS